MDNCWISCQVIDNMKKFFNDLPVLLNFPKNQRKIGQMSVLESKYWSNHKFTTIYPVCSTYELTNQFM